MYATTERPSGEPCIRLPVSVSREAERIADRHGATVIWTKLSAAHLMEVAQQRGIDLAASQEGGFIWPSFLPAYDAAATRAPTGGGRGS